MADSVWTCAWCAAVLADGAIKHRGDCAWIAEVKTAERQRIRDRLLRCRDCGHIHGENALFEHGNRAPWVPAGPDALPFLGVLLGDGPIP
jgi:hypothetical protein